LRRWWSGWKLLDMMSGYRLALFTLKLPPRSARWRRRCVKCCGYSTEDQSNHLPAGKPEPPSLRADELEEIVKLFRGDIYRDHIMTELLVQAGDADDAREEINRAWQGWEIRSVVEALPMTRTWKIGSWTTD
jgi:hypothetical protein